jgi:hypothetical protein
MASLLEATGQFQAVFADTPKETGNFSPISFVESINTGWVNHSYSVFHRAHRLAIHIWWDRRQASADDFDDLSQVVFDMLEANLSVPGVWESLMIDEQSDGSFLGYANSEEESGLSYREEIIPVIVW